MPEYPIQELAEAIARSISPDEFDQAAHSALGHFDRITGEAAVTVACREGCSLCCWLRVDVFAHEVFLVARHIRSHFAEGRISSLLVRLAEHSSKVGAMTPFEHATTNVPCPLLRDGRCSVYPVRPHSCRRHHSLDLGACQFTFDHPSDLEAPAAHDRGLFQTLAQAMQENIAAYSASEFDQTIYEFGSALKEALTDPSSWRRWLDHDQAFLHASVTPGS